MRPGPEEDGSEDRDDPESPGLRLGVVRLGRAGGKVRQEEETGWLLDGCVHVYAVIYYIHTVHLEDCTAILQEVCVHDLQLIKAIQK